MPLHIIHLAAFKHRRPHGGVLNAVIGQDRRGQLGSQDHLRKPAGIFLGDLVIAGPQLFLLCIGKAPDPVHQDFGLLKEHRQPVPRNGVRVCPHLLGGGNDDSHTVPTSDMPFRPMKIGLDRQSSLLFCFPIFLLGSLFKAFHRFQVCFFHRRKRLCLKFPIFRLRLFQRLLMAHSSGILQKLASAGGQYRVQLRNIIPHIHGPMLNRRDFCQIKVTGDQVINSAGRQVRGFKGIGSLIKTSGFSSGGWQLVDPDDNPFKT